MPTVLTGWHYDNNYMLIKNDKNSEGIKAGQYVFFSLNVEISDTCKKRTMLFS